MKWARIVALGAALCSAAAQADEEADAELAANASQVLQTKCHSCHGANGSRSGNVDYIVDLAKLIETQLVVPGRAADSKIVQLVDERKMPKPPRAALLPEERDALAAWIDAGAPLVVLP